MGELLRRYWYPVAFTRELEEFPVRPARLLGEDFAVFKTPRGRYGMLPEACPHRRASLTYGVVEADGLRCPYHGWLFGPTAPAWTSPPSGRRPTSATGSGRSPGRCRSSAA
jgi:Phenylpropionate dioxygenase and related ring-hydroxylating dioxygenases, large terminal subunit